MTTSKTTDECKRMLVRLAIKHGIPPKLISERLLSLEDKKDMLQGLITAEMLDSFVKVWKESGMSHYANGTGELYGSFRYYLRVRVGSA